MASFIKKIFLSHTPLLVGCFRPMVMKTKAHIGGGGIGAGAIGAGGLRTPPAYKASSVFVKPAPPPRIAKVTKVTHHHTTHHTVPSPPVVVAPSVVAPSSMVTTTTYGGAGYGRATYIGFVPPWAIILIVFVVLGIIIGVVTVFCKKKENSIENTYVSYEPDHYVEPVVQQPYKNTVVEETTYVQPQYMVVQPQYGATTYVQQPSTVQVQVGNTTIPCMTGGKTNIDYSNGVVTTTGDAYYADGEAIIEEIQVIDDGSDTVTYVERDVYY